MMGKDTSRAAKHHTNLDPLSVSCHALSSTLAWCKRLREHQGTMWTQFIWLTGCMTERRHHAATLKVKTLQSARQPAMQKIVFSNVPESVHHRRKTVRPEIQNKNCWPRNCRKNLCAARMPDACNTDLQQLPYPGTANNGVETSCTREMRSCLVTQVEGCMKFGSPRGQDFIT